MNSPAFGSPWSIWDSLPTERVTRRISRCHTRLPSLRLPPPALRWSRDSGWLPAPAVVVLADYAFAITCHPRCAVVALTAEFAGLVAVPPVGQRVAARWR